MVRPEAALIEKSDFYRLAHTVVPSCEYSITPWGVCEGLVNKVFEGTSRNASKDAPPIMLGSCAEIAKASIVLATAKPGVAVRHINTDVVADPAKKGYEHLGQRHYGKAPWIYLPILIANAHSGWFPEGSHTLFLSKEYPRLSGRQTIRKTRGNYT